ncbi:MAG: GNAT family N-acetyltransferase [Phaeodactylibacter sp.]|nr:GNAT family N-acetyltransferase [Phaeodactylibacter sp.]
MDEAVSQAKNVDIRLENNPAVIARLNTHVHGPHYEKHPDRYAPYDYDKFVAWYQAVLAREGAYGLVAYLDDEPVGYALLFHKKNNGEHTMLAYDYEYVHVEEMAVAAGHQHKGIGRQLMVHIREFCREKGAKRVQLSVWLDNEAAKAFYEKEGFEGYLLYMEMPVE